MPTTRRRAVALAALCGVLAAGCQGGQREDGGTTSTGPTSAEEPEPSQTRSPAPEQTYRPVRFEDGPVFNEPLADDVTTAQLQRLVDEERVPVAPTHGGAFETMTNSLRVLDEAPDVMIFGDSMTQQGIDPQVLGEQLAERTGSPVSVFNAASSRARWGVNRMVARYARSVDRLPQVAVLSISTRAAEDDGFYTSTVQRTPFSHVVEGCDRPSSPVWDAAERADCEADRTDLRHRFALGGGQVRRALDGRALQTTLQIAPGSRLRADGMIEHPSMTRAEVEQRSRTRLAERGFPGFPTILQSSIDEFTELVDLLEAEGVTVISTEIPYSPAHQAGLERIGRDYDAKRQKAAARLAREGGTQHFPVASYGDWWGDGSSRDEIHLAPQGAADFTEQLVDDTPGLADAIEAGLR
ncbi:SGNH/GDSL hydrolase family protein [Janibacter melonis]|uniref:SGNH/GDSL hydrolase family protein n=1 Tax=Janibacter melonis TaxID=262209 RepID=UPI00191A7F80|nr:SGNH/GDSL hydrolase family protein [Janibacter melonis]